MTSASARRRGTRLRSAIRAGIVAVGAAATVVFVAPPASASCPLLDRDCLQATIEQTAGTVTGTIDDPVGTVTGAAGEITGQVADTVDGLLGRGPNDPPAGGGPGDDPATPGAGGGPGHGPAGRPHHDPGRPPAQAAGPAPGPSLAADPPGAPSVDSRSPGEHRSQGEGITRVIAAGARRLGFPIALGVLVLVFAALEHRLDCNDPRMVRAPVAPDVLRFG